MAHLTCVGHTREELARDPRRPTPPPGSATCWRCAATRARGRGAPWTPTPGGLTYAAELVALVRALGGFSVGVAAFPEGHPAAESLDADARVLAAKADAGAEFAVTQMFFRAADYFALVERVRAARRRHPDPPGHHADPNLGRSRRMAELSGADVPDEVVARIDGLDGDPAAVRAEGIAIATELCERAARRRAPRACTSTR